MIQRIQSLYLLLAGIFPAITLFSSVMLFSKDEKWITLSSMGYDATMIPEFAGKHPYGLTIFTFLSVVLAIVALFGYKNRKTQLRKVFFAICSNILWYVSCAAYSYAVVDATKLSPWFNFTILFPLLAIVALFMARRGIQKDEELVRAADRIR